MAELADLPAGHAVIADKDLNAQVAELADAHGSGPCDRKVVGVQVSSWAQI